MVRIVGERAKENSWDIALIGLCRKPFLSSQFPRSRSTIISCRPMPNSTPATSSTLCSSHRATRSI